MLLENLSWPEVKKLKPARKVVLFPLGSFEQHGPHLPLTTDTDIVTAIARRVEQKRVDKILCLPTLWPGHSTHHLFFPGTLSVRQMPYIQMVIELCHSVGKMGGRRVFLLNGHGGNDVPLRAALRELKSDFPKAQFVLRLTGLWLQRPCNRCANQEWAAWVMPAKWKRPSCSTCIPSA